LNVRYISQQVKDIHWVHFFEIYSFSFCS
jgi:hypothetical protein